MSLTFKKNLQPFTLGVEIELQVLSKDNLLLTPRAIEIISRCPAEKFKQEFFQSTLEIITGVCDHVQDIENDLSKSINLAFEESEKLNLTLGSSGTHPLADYRERLVTSSPRYDQLIDRNQWLTRRMAVYGMHIHIGMPSGDACIAFNNFFITFVPHIIALSGSSPFWQGMYTGLASCRPTTYEALPTAGMPYLVNNWKEFQDMYALLVQSNSIQGFRDLWWDLRPSPALGTLELRCCDQPATLNEILAITSFVHLLAHWFSDHQARWKSQPVLLDPWILRENKWRALRYGLRAEIITDTQGGTKLLADDIVEWVTELKLYAQTFRYENYLSTIMDLLHGGTSSERQHRVFVKSQDLIEVVKHNVREFHAGHPIFS